MRTVNESLTFVRSWSQIACVQVKGHRLLWFAPFRAQWPLLCQMVSPETFHVQVCEADPWAPMGQTSAGMGKVV